ncbi:MAG TPA: hypothetical protein VIL09_01790, partial [Microvirga sp.]
MTAQTRSNSSPSPYRGPVVPPPHPSGLSSVLERNIHALSERRRQEERDATLQERVAEVITR